MGRKILKPTCYEEHEVMQLPASFRASSQELLPPSVKPVLDRLIDQADYYAKQGYLLLLSGVEGCGKSCAAAVVAKATMETGVRALWATQWTLGDAQRWDQPYSAGETILQRIKTISLLVIDDLLPFTDADRFWTERELRILLRQRSDARRSTIITTCRPISDWKFMQTGYSNFLPLEIKSGSLRRSVKKPGPPEPTNPVGSPEQKKPTVDWG